MEKQSITLGPGESADLAVRFDSLDQPDFRGGLSIEVAGHGVTGEVVFATHVGLEVRTERVNQPGPENTAGPKTADLLTLGQRGAP